MPWGPERWALANLIPAAADVRVTSSLSVLPVPASEQGHRKHNVPVPSLLYLPVLPWGTRMDVHHCTSPQRSHGSMDRCLSHYLCSCRGDFLQPEQGLLSLEQLQQLLLYTGLGTYSSFPRLSASLEQHSSFLKYLNICTILWDPYTAGTREKT